MQAFFEGCHQRRVMPGARRGRLLPHLLRLQYKATSREAAATPHDAAATPHVMRTTRRVGTELTPAMLLDIQRVAEGARSDPAFRFHLGTAPWAVPVRFCADPPLRSKAPGFMAAIVVEATLPIHAAVAAPHFSAPRSNVSAFRLRRLPWPKLHRHRWLQRT